MARDRLTDEERIAQRKAAEEETARKREVEAVSNQTSELLHRVYTRSLLFFSGLAVAMDSLSAAQVKSQLKPAQIPFVPDSILTIEPIRSFGFGRGGGPISFYLREWETTACKRVHPKSEFDRIITQLYEQSSLAPTNEPQAFVVVNNNGRSRIIPSHDVLPDQRERLAFTDLLANSYLAAAPKSYREFLDLIS